MKQKQKGGQRKRKRTNIYEVTVYSINMKKRWDKPVLFYRNKDKYKEQGEVSTKKKTY